MSSAVEDCKGMDKLGDDDRKGTGEEQGTSGAKVYPGIGRGRLPNSSGIVGEEEFPSLSGAAAAAAKQGSSEVWQKKKKTGTNTAANSNGVAEVGNKTPVKPAAKTAEPEPAAWVKVTSNRKDTTTTTVATPIGKENKPAAKVVASPLKISAATTQSHRVVPPAPTAIKPKPKAPSSISSDGKSDGRKGKSFVKGRKSKGDFITDQTEFCDIVKSRQQDVKQGTQGKKVEFMTNYYPLIKLTNFNLFHYHIEYKPDEERTEVRKKLVRIHETILGSFIFDGQGLYTPHRIASKSLYLYSMNPFTKAKTQICLKLVAEISPSDPVFLQVYNIMFRNIMTSLDLEPMGRFYYDPAAKIRIPTRKLEVWPGYITSVRNHEHQILLNLEITHKVIRSDSVLDFINNVKESARGDYRREVAKLLLGTIVVTSYNKKNYKVDDIKWDVTPNDSFQMKDQSQRKYSEYYKAQYGTVIKDLSQPMLISLPKKKDYHRGSTQPIYLVPEICQMTGLSECMRKDVKLMRELAEHLSMTPSRRIQHANAFIERWYSTPKIVKEFKDWNIEVGKEAMKCMGRIVDLDDLIVVPSMGRSLGTAVTPGIKVKQDKPGEWINLFKNKGMLSTVDLKKWILIIPPQQDQVIGQAMVSLKAAAKSMNFILSEPLLIYKMTDLKPTSFATAIGSLARNSRESIQMFVVVLPNNNAEVYSAIKRKTYVELGVACQCVIIKTLMNKNLPAITNRLAIQMNAKLGGVPWSVEIPLREIMIIGYDVFHSPNRRVPSVGALVASTSQSLARYFTSTYFHKNRSELSANLCNQMTNALLAYKTLNNGSLPKRIILYRDGVGDGQLSYIYNTELAQIQTAIQNVYSGDMTKAKFSFIVVTKRIHTRIFYPGLLPRTEINPPPGTVIDDVITLPERYDFFLVSQQVTGNMGTVSPTSYNVLYDEQGLDPDKMQRLTIKLCHLYYNFTGTIAVPAPCQFAHKLAYLTGTSLSTEAHQKLQNYLYFL